ncbi:MAG: hypothetical protein K0R38_7646 [Polyangiaceae bacterium]|jgi:uncharacterized protein YecE (DUF72 family)|nr:hypothetical protein [Polyangiaceae bacterium]
MDLLVGTSGFSYAEWKGSFYPAGLPDAEMLTSYAERLPTVEINNTFYRMPQPSLLEGWNQKVAAPGFTFALKAPRSITHISRLKDAQDGTLHFLKVAATLGPRLGPLLFQLPPFLRKDAAVLRDFLALLPEGVKAAFEFRHASWFDDEVSQLLSDRGAALVAGDPDEGEALPLLPTAPFGYLRLRAASYDLAGLTAWHERIAAQPWQTAYVYLKHEVLGPSYAQGLQQLHRGQTPTLPVATPEQAAPPKQRKAAKKAAAAGQRATKAKPENEAAAKPQKRSLAAKKPSKKG